MAHFLLTPVGSSGDVHPFVGIGRALRARGHDVTLLTAEPFRRISERAGLHFVGTHSEEDFDRLTKHPDLWHSRHGMTLVLQDAGVGDARRLRAHRRRVQAGPDRSGWPRAEFCDAGVRGGPRRTSRDHSPRAVDLPVRPSTARVHSRRRPVRLASVGEAHDVVAGRSLAHRSAVVPELNRWRRELGLEPVSRVFKEWLHSPRRVIGLFPEWFAPIQPDWPPQLRLTGFPLYDEPDEHALSPGLQTFLDRGSPPILFTPGSANRAASQFFAAALDATRRLGRRALFLTRYPEQLPATLGSDAWHEPYVPFSHVLPRCAAIVHHGGIGTCAQGLAAGSAAVDDAARVRSAGQHDAVVAAGRGALGAPARVPR